MSAKVEVRTLITSSGFRDGLGERVLAFDRPAGEVRERLRVRPELAAFETALGAQIDRVSKLTDPRFPRARDVDRDRATGQVVVVSDYVPGERLSDLLDAAHERGVFPDIAAALQTAGELLLAMTSFSGALKAVHGAIAPSRIVLSETGDVVITDYLFAPVLPRLRFSPSRLWSDLGIAGGLDGVAFDEASDARQIALVLIAMALGRRIGPDEYPARIPALVAEICDVALISGGDGLATGLRAWLERVLNLEGRQGFGNMAHACASFGQLTFDGGGLAGSRSALVTFLADIGRPPQAIELPAPPPVMRIVAPLAPAVTSEPEPEPTVFAALEPEPIVIPDPEPMVFAARESVVIPELEPETIEIPVPEPVAIWSREPVPFLPPEPEPVAFVEPEPVAMVEPTPVSVFAARVPDADPSETFASEMAPQPDGIDLGVRAAEPSPFQFVPLEPLPEPEPAPPPLAPLIEAPFELTFNTRSEFDPDPVDEPIAEKPVVPPVAPAAVPAELPVPVDAAPLWPDPAPPPPAASPQPAPGAPPSEPAPVAAPELAPSDAHGRKKRKLRKLRLRRRDADPPAPPAVSEPPPPPLPPAVVYILPDIPPPGVSPLPAPSPPFSSVMMPDIPPPGVVPLPPPSPIFPAMAAKGGGPPVLTTPSPPGPIRLKDPSRGVIARARQLDSRDVSFSARLEAPSRSTVIEVPERTRLGPFKFAAILIVLAVAGFAAFKFSWSPVAAEPGMLTVETTPAGSQVYVDGELRGKTPLTIPVDAGKHELKLTRRGLTHTRSVTVEEGKTRLERYAWSRARQAGRGGLRVSSEPPGAKVLVDGKLQGETPLDLPNIPVGSHTVTIESGIGSVRRTVTVVRGEEALVDVELYSGFVKVFAPIELELSVNGRSVGNGSEPIMLPPGEQAILAVNNDMGYREVHTIEVEPGETRTLTITPVGRLTVTAVPWADVWIGETRAGQTPLTNRRVPIGTHALVLKHPEHGERRVITTVRHSAETVVHVDLTKP
ncbi:MAG: PEGA domain-containing protein [Vicinamibacterales bacterium]